jgi:hypothetical protein
MSLNHILTLFLGRTTTRLSLALIRCAGVALAFDLAEFAVNVLLVLFGYPTIALVPTGLVLLLVGLALGVSLAPTALGAYVVRRDRLRRAAILHRRMYDRLVHTHGVELCGGLASDPRTTGTFARRDPNYDGWMRVADRAHRGGLIGWELRELVERARHAASEAERRGGEMNDEDVALAEFVATEAKRLARWDARLPGAATA